MRKETYAKYLFEAILDCIQSPPQTHGRDTVLEKLRIVDKNPSVISTLRQVFSNMSQDPINRRFFQPGSGASRLTRTQSTRNSHTGARPKRSKRSGSWDRDRHRSPYRQNRNGMFRSERLTRSTIAARFDDFDDGDDFGHGYYRSPMPPPVRRSEPSLSQQDDKSEQDDKCPICLDTLKQPKTLKCKHKFCRTCLDGSVKHQGQTCPVCKEPFGKGRRARTMPPGKMDVRTDPHTHIPGYPDAKGAIVITYTFTSGVQGVSIHHRCLWCNKTKRLS